jgi:hypothetical protein
MIGAEGWEDIEVGDLVFDAHNTQIYAIDGP